MQVSSLHMDVSVYVWFSDRLTRTDPESANNQVSRDPCGNVYMVTHIILEHHQPPKGVSRKSTTSYMKMRVTVDRFVATGRIFSIYRSPLMRERCV